MFKVIGVAMHVLNDWLACTVSSAWSSHSSSSWSKHAKAIGQDLLQLNTVGRRDHGDVLELVDGKSEWNEWPRTHVAIGVIIALVQFVVEHAWTIRVD